MARVSNNLATPRQLSLIEGDFDTAIAGAELSRERAGTAGYAVALVGEVRDEARETAPRGDVPLPQFPSQKG
jgi:hypothetical protein